MNMETASVRETENVKGLSNTQATTTIDGYMRRPTRIADPMAFSIEFRVSASLIPTFTNSVVFPRKGRAANARRSTGNRRTMAAPSMELTRDEQEKHIAAMVSINKIAATLGLISLVVGLAVRSES
mmetsp:Transcript_488/g.849  ORF Transcript_488/g.849 Transcript_488/m.849 type:complete len:126 (+) Transcript_488:1621-1998(+)